eukprot:TRINITY_DN6586_c0_g3_i1.p1 TRINITY_DN6586_c0_g3~~TRINITY_DN6586_c0_g3_i1.p1  ORF type:complete len:528 (-),score=121.08 TRINITY_DN6586_c0_g3_i1:45-1628(-)
MSAAVPESRFKRFAKCCRHFGPALYIAVGYIDPGNWATDIEAGSRFGYKLVWVVLVSNIVALILQAQCVRLGLATGRDLARHSRDAYGKVIGIILWAMAELAIVATDLAEVIGTALGLNLLFNLPMMAGVFLTAADTLLLLCAQRVGWRVLEIVLLVLLSLVVFCFIFELFLSGPDGTEVAKGMFIPTIPAGALYAAAGIFGATVMPHNLYLHSSVVQRPSGVPPKQAYKWCIVDTVIALNGAAFVNASIIIVSAATFFARGIEVTEIQQAHQMLESFLGRAAGIVFGLGLVCSGQSSALAGTMAGQVVMEGFIEIKVQPWVRRLITRAIAIVPAAVTIAVAGSEGTFKLLVLSQVILSLQLPFAVIPLVRFTSDMARMADLQTPKWLAVVSWLCALIVLSLNLSLIGTKLVEWAQTGETGAYVAVGFAVPISLLLLALLGYCAFGKISPIVGYNSVAMEEYAAMEEAQEQQPLDQEGQEMVETAVSLQSQQESTEVDRVEVLVAGAETERVQQRLSRTSFASDAKT